MGAPETTPQEVVETEFQNRLAPRDKVLDFLGVDACKLVFRYYAPKVSYERKNESWPKVEKCVLLVDYGLKEPIVQALPAHRAMKPVISPDGTHIVYNTSFHPTEIFIRELTPEAEPVQAVFGATPRWWRDERNSELYVLYRTEIAKTKWPEHIGNTMLLRIDPETYRPAGEPRQIYDQGFSGGLSPNGEWLATGYHTLDMVNLRTGGHYALLRDGQTENAQVCGVSTAPDNSGRVMQLRLPHDRFGIVKYDGTGDEVFWLPEGAVEWQTPEWSNHPDYCAAVASNQEGKYELYIVRIPDHEKIKVVWGQSYLHPCLWCRM